MIKIEDVKKFFEDNYYIADEKLVYYTTLSLNLINEGKMRLGQDIYTVCFDGPPGSGKSLYAKLYAKMVSTLLQKETVLISYQCDEATSKIELFEDINVASAVAGYPDKVNIPGVLTNAIRYANDGKKVILFIDEYDKTREQVDSLFLQFLQDGRINTNQFGNIEIEEKYKGNIQVIFCKNDFRTELTGPLMRRTRILPLDIIKPADFLNLAKRIYSQNGKNIDINIINLVSLIYEEIYNNRHIYNRVCATSELYACIEDLDFLISINTPKNIIFDVIMEDLFKNKDDAAIFKEKIPNIPNAGLRNILIDFAQNNEDPENISLTEIIHDYLLKDIKVRAEQKAKEAYNAELKRIEDLKTDIAKEKESLEKEKKNIEQIKQELYQKNKQFLDEYQTKFDELLEKQATSPVTNPNLMKYESNFDEANSNIKRGQDVFTSTTEKLVTYKTLTIPKEKLTKKDLNNYLSHLGAIIYENGFLINKNNLYKLIIVRQKNKNANNIIYEFKVNEQIYKTCQIPDYKCSIGDKELQDIINSYIYNIVKGISTLNGSIKGTINNNSNNNLNNKSNKSLADYLSITPDNTNAKEEAYKLALELGEEYEV